MNPTSKTCLVTGGRGYLGSEVMRYLQNAGWKVFSASRHPKESTDIRYDLGGDLTPGALEGISALVHCAYDFGPTRWDEIHQKNVVGTQRLLDQAKSAGIDNIITISSISAFDGCRSLYGKAKLEIEKATLAAGGIALRPGLIYGGSDQGMYGRLVAQVNRGKPIPLLSGSSCTQFLVNVEDLCGLIEGLLSGTVSRPASPFVVAHPEPWPLRKLLTAIAGNRKLRLIPIPWQFVWLGLRTLESVGLKMNFKSDSVRSIVYQNQHPDFSEVRRLGVNLRAFQP